MTALARTFPIETPIGGDTIATIPRYRNPVGLCVEDPEVSQLRPAPHANLFKVRLANTEVRRESASYLIRRRYAWRGYCANDSGADDGAAKVPNRIVIAAHDSEGVVGTVTVGLDSGDELFIDGLYSEQANRLRDEGRRIAEFTKLAVENNVHSKPLLAALFHIAYICARRIHDCTDLLIEVNPRHATFYQRMLAFERFGDMRGDPRIGAPALLLRLRLDRAQKQIEQLGGKIELAAVTRSLYPYFFAPREEILIERRLRALG